MQYIVYDVSHPGPEALWESNNPFSQRIFLNISTKIQIDSRKHFQFVYTNQMLESVDSIWILLQESNLILAALHVLLSLPA
jgi:hypothetical protein